MIYILFVFIVLICGDMVHAQPATATAEKPALMVIGGDTINLGYVLPGMVRHEVKLVNTGTEPVRIVDVNSVVAIIGELDRSLLRPGDTATLPLSLETITTIGEKRASVEIETDNPAQRYVNLRLRASVSRPLYSRGGGTGGVVGEVMSTSITFINMSPEEVTLAPTAEQVGCCDCHADIWADLSGTRYIRAGDSITVPIGMVARRTGSIRCDLEFRAVDPDVQPQRVIITAYAMEPQRKD